MILKHLHFGWYIVIIGACMTAAHGIVMYTFGVFLIPLTTEFNWERGVLSGVYSTFLLTLGIFSILTGRLSDKYGPRILLTIAGILMGTGFLLLSQINSLWQAYLIWALFIGVGGSCLWVPLVSTIPRWFAKKRGIAIGLTIAGFGLGGIIGPPLVQRLISIYDWRQSYLILGSILFIMIIPLAQFMKHSPQRIGLEPYGKGKNTKAASSPSPAEGAIPATPAIRTSRFWIWGLLLFSLFFSAQVVLVHIVPHATDIGISPILAASILSIIAGCSVIGQLSVGLISNKIGGRLLLVACTSLVTLALIWFPFAREIRIFYMPAAMLGLAYGSIILLQSFITAELFGLSSLGMILGGLTLLTTIGEFLGGPIAGSIFDITGSYNLAFLISVIFSALAIILSLILLKVKD